VQRLHTPPLGRGREADVVEPRPRILGLAAPRR
jgi:hypothetical protein